MLVEEGELLGRRVLDVGCGTGRLSLALAEQHGCRVWGVDSSAQMLDEAQQRAGRRVSFKQAAAEALPFRGGWFERAVLRLVVHHLDRPVALPEVARVIGSGGRVVIATFRPEHFAGFWLNPYFPSIRSIDETRFPAPQTLAAELVSAGFAPPRIRALTQTVETTRVEALERLRGRFISTLQLLSQDEYSAGLARAERELPERVSYLLEWAVVTAELGGRPAA